MKFSNGCWLNKDEFTRYNPQEVYSFDFDEKVLTMYAPCNKIVTRGDTLGGPVITYKISSPVENIIRVRIYHYDNTNNESMFKVNDEGNTIVKLDEQGDNINFSSGNLKVKINKKNFSMEFYNEEKFLTKSENRGFAYFKKGTEVFLDEDSTEKYVKEELGLSVGETVYGLGERFTPFVKNGQSIDIWNEDGGTSTHQSYKNIPFYMTNRGYGVFVNHSEKVSFEVASESVTKVQFSVPGEYLDYYIIAGDSMKDVIKNYTYLTGKPALPPAWSFGLWLTTSFTTNYDEETVSKFIDEMAQRDIPLNVFHFDCFWMKDFSWCDFEWDKRVFPDPQGMLKRLKAKGLKICVWINPYISQLSKLFKEGKSKGYFIKKFDGNVWQYDMWQPGMAIVDFTNPEACEWYSSKLEALMEMGVDCFKTDFAERIPTNCKYFDGSDPYKMHNYYTHLYNKTVFDVIKKVKGEKEAVLFARSATVGGQQYPVHWGGDCSANYESMSESLRGGLSLCMSGFGFWSHDIGGFESISTPDIYKRWAAFGLLSSHSRLHGSTSYRVPWVYDEEACDVVRFFTKLKCSLMPYIYKFAVDASTIGLPLMRAMILEYENDNNCKYLEGQYMLGDSILVAPIFNAEGIANYYLPEGKWTNYITGKKYKGGQWVSEKHDYLSIPMMIKENSIIPIGSFDNNTNYDFGEDVTLEVFDLVEGKEAKVEIINEDGEIILAGSGKRMNDTLEFNIKSKGSYKILLRNIFDIFNINVANRIVSEKGIVIIADSNVENIVCEISK